MTAKRRDISDLPDWPRLMSVDQASAYCGVSPNQFRTHVGIEPMRLGGRILFDRKLLDRWLDSTSGVGNHDQKTDWVEQFNAGQDQGRPQGQG